MKTLNKTFLCILLCLFIQISSYSQPSVTWEKIYNRPPSVIDAINDICEADSGNYFLAGYTTIPPFTINKIWVVKINSYGDTIWTRIIGIDGSSAFSVASSSDGGCVLTGRSGQAFSIKLNRTGNIVWERYYGGSGVQSTKIIKTSDRGYIACGRINLQDGYVFKIDSSGNFKWDKIYPSNELKYFFDIQEAFGTGFIICGINLESLQDTLKSIVSRVDEKGNLRWEKKYKIKGQSGSFAINKLENYYIISGSTLDFSNPINMNFFGKIDTNGNLLNYNILKTTSHEYFGSFELINKNKFVITLTRDSLDTYYGKAILSDSSGNIINQKLFLTPDFSDFKSIHLVMNGDIIFTGIAGFNIPGSDVIGYAVRTDSNLFYKTVSINSNQTNIPQEFDLFQNYPNPFNPLTTIKYKINKESVYKLNLYNINGIKIATLLNSKIEPGDYQYKLDASSLNLTSGIYFVELKGLTGNYANIKILFLK